MNNVLTILKRSFQSKARASSRAHADIVSDDFIVVQIVGKDSGKILVHSLNNLSDNKVSKSVNMDPMNCLPRTSLETSQSKLASLSHISFIICICMHKQHSRPPKLPNTAQNNRTIQPRNSIGISSSIIALKAFVVTMANEDGLAANRLDVRIAHVL